ncbi:hypothetical protein PybrP1_008187 [[Pythium] brassicae (nom. inval.)]|nr:hypothetical protein PybrP1_008187 [[Pythium] brassicae (nom. inval.)]
MASEKANLNALSHSMAKMKAELEARAPRGAQHKQGGSTYGGLGSAEASGKKLYKTSGGPGGGMSLSFALLFWARDTFSALAVGLAVQVARIVFSVVERAPLIDSLSDDADDATFMVAHRLATVRGAAIIAEKKGGVVAEFGGREARVRKVTVSLATAVTMETLASVFPAVPALALERVLEICDGDVETASAWLLENNWRDVLERDGDDDDDTLDGDDGDVAQAEDEDDDQEDGDPPPPLMRVSATAPSRPPLGEETNPGLTISGGSLQRPGNAVAAAAAAPGAAADAPRRLGPHGYFARRGGHAGAMLRAAGRHDDREFDSGGEHDGESDDYEEDEDEDDEDDDDDDDDDDAHSYYDSGDDAFFHGGLGGGLAPLAKRVKITKEDADAAAEARANDPKQEMYWVAFDGQVVRKTLIEAKAKLVSVLDAADDANASEPTPAAGTVASSAPTGARRNGIDHILNDADAEPAGPSAQDDDETKAAVAAPATGQKRKRTADDSGAWSPAAAQGFFAHFFSVSDLDMIWRSVMHAHLFNTRDFDELMHIHANMASSRAASLGLSPAATLKCCLILPCGAAEEEIFRVGKHLHSLLKLQGSLYYRSLHDAASMAVTASTLSAVAASSGVAAGAAAAAAGHSAGSSRLDLFPVRSTRLELLNEDGKMTEDSFRRFARYRIKKEELEAVESKDAHALGPDHFLAYQQQRKVQFCLQALTIDGWDRRLSS